MMNGTKYILSPFHFILSLKVFHTYKENILKILTYFYKINCLFIFFIKHYSIKISIL